MSATETANTTVSEADRQQYRSYENHTIDATVVRNWLVECSACTYEWRAGSEQKALMFCKHHETEHERSGVRHECAYKPIIDNLDCV